LTTPLIATAAGQKMSKSAGNAAWLDPNQTSPYDYYQYWRNTEDADVGRFLRMFTFLPLEQIAELEGLRDAELNRAKEILALEATKITHGEEEALKAQQTAHARFGGGGADLGPSLSVTQPTSAVDLAVEARLVESRNAAKRLIREGGMRLGETKLDADRLVEPAELPLLLSVGKRKVRLVAGS
jgi:tyrosyl-tRNA synthetase